MSASPLRAPNGAGTIYRRKDGRFEASARVLMPNGGRRRVSVYGTTRDEVRRKLTALLSRSDNGVPEADRSWTVSAWLDHWMEHIVSVRNRPRTIERYEQIVRVYLKPHIGGRRLAQLTVSDVQTAVNTLHAHGTGPRTIQQIRGVLSAALGRAEREELVHRNVARLIDLPKYEPKEIHPWGIDEARTFLAATKGHPWEIGFHLLLVYGMRRGEAIGLRWGDIDFETGAIHVRQQLQRIAGEIVAGEVKTAAGRRTLPLLPEIRTLLEARADADGVDPISAAARERLILTSSSGLPVEPANFARTFHMIADKLGLRRITVHQTRHTAATMLKSAGVQARDVQLILGHANVSTTQQLYQHGVLDEHREALSGVAAALLADQPDSADEAAGGLVHVGDGHNGRQRRPFALSHDTFSAARQGILPNENRRLPEVVTADFDGGTSGARTHDTLLKSSLEAAFAELPTSVLGELQARTRQLVLGALAVKMTVKSDYGRRSAYQTGSRRLIYSAARGASLAQLRQRSFPLSLLPSRPPTRKERP